MAPMYEIRGRGVGPLVTAQPALGSVVVLVQQVKEVKCAVVKKRHTVAHKAVRRFRLEVLHDLPHR